MEKQKVHFGHLLTGQPGLFTGNTLALPLNWSENSESEARKVAERCGLEFESKPAPLLAPYEE